MPLPQATWTKKSGSALTLTISMWAAIHLIEQSDINDYAPWHNRRPNPLSPSFTWEYFQTILADRTEIKVAKPQAFSWLTFGQVPFGARNEDSFRSRLSQVEGVDMAGQSFMQAVFGLTPGRVAAAMNQPQTSAYVIRLIELTPPDAQLLKEFQEQNSFLRYASVVLEEQQAIERTWKKKMLDAAGLTWEQTPVEPRRNAAAEPIETDDE